LALRVRQALASYDGVSERAMFGGLAFMLHGHMCCGVVGDELVARIGPTQAAAALAMPYTRPMDFTGRPFKGFVFVQPAGLRGEQALRRWVAKACAYVATLPQKGRSQPS
jgi:hypothetical protein